MRPPNNNKAAVESLCDPGLQRNRPTVALQVGQYPGTCSGDSVDRQNDGAPVLRAVTCLLPYVRPYMRFLHMVKHFRIGSDRIVSYRDILCDIVSYRVPYGCIVPSLIYIMFIIFAAVILSFVWLYDI